MCSLPSRPWLLDNVVEGTDGITELIGVFRRLTVGLDRDHQILVGNPDVERPIAKTFSLVEPYQVRLEKDSGKASSCSLLSTSELPAAKHSGCLRVF